MQVNKTTLIEKLVHSKGKSMPYAEYGPKSVRPEPEMGDFPEKFQAMFFWLKWKFFPVTDSQDLY